MTHDEKRLDVAKRAMQGLLAADDPNSGPERLAELAVLRADALLTALTQEDPRIACAARLVEAETARNEAERAFDLAQGEAQIITADKARNVALDLRDQRLAELHTLFTTDKERP